MSNKDETSLPDAAVPDVLTREDASLFEVASLAPFPSTDEVLPEAFDRTITGSSKRKRKASSSARQKTLTELIEQFLDELSIEHGYSAPSLRLREGDLQLYAAWLQTQGVNSPRSVTPALFERFVHDLRAGQIHEQPGKSKRPVKETRFYTAPILARKLAAVRDWHRFLAREYRWPDPAARLKIAAVPPRTLPVLSDVQKQALLAVPDLSQPLGRRDRALLLLLCEGVTPPQIGALRNSEAEIALLPVSENTRLALRDYMTRVRPILAASLRGKARSALAAKSGKTNAIKEVPWLFFSNRGTTLSPMVIHQVVRRHATQANLPAWVSAVMLSKAGAQGALASGNSHSPARLPRATQLRHAFDKAHPRA